MPDGTETTFDWATLGNDAETVRNIYNGGPMEVHKQLIKKRSANAEAATYRTLLDEYGKVTSVDVAEFVRLHKQLANGSVTYDQLDADQREIADKILVTGILEPKAIGAPEDILEQIEASMNEPNETKGGEPVDKTQESAEMAQMRQELAEAKAQAEAAKLTTKLAELGADPKKIAHLRKLVELPQRGEDMSDEDYAKATNEYFEGFKNEFGWGFGAANVAGTDNRQIAAVGSKNQEAIRAEAREKGDTISLIENAPRIAEATHTGE